MAAVYAVELGADLVLGAFADRMTGQAFLERLLARGDVLRARRRSASQSPRQARQDPFQLSFFLLLHQKSAAARSFGR